MMTSQKVPPETAINVTSNITIVPAQEAFLVDATPTTPSADRWIEAKPRSTVRLLVSGMSRAGAVARRRCECPERVGAW